ncbi:MAG: TfoX/Sxy family DNA transformation protein [Gammaproteobacteria bacterium]|nr:TfoX/Sxy family DNA transformation protein [Gammaproteobacteria bacterium]
MSDIPVTELPNIGATIARRLATLGITTRDELAKIGAAKTYQLLCQMEQSDLPVCYNLYSLEAALRGHDWRLLDDDEKRRLKEAAILKTI